MTCEVSNVCITELEIVHRKKGKEGEDLVRYFKGNL